MTKQVGIENADTSNWPVRVTVENKQPDGTWLAQEAVQLDYPTSMTQQYLTSHRRLVIEERSADAPT